MPQHVFLLGSSFGPVRFHFAIDRFPRAWRRTPPWSEGMPVAVRRRRGYWEITGENTRPEALEAFRSACEREGVAVLRDLGGDEPRFGPTPVVEAVSPSIGLPWLAAEVFGRGDREVVQLLLDVASAIGQAALWRLIPGPPDDTAQVVLDLVRCSRPVSSPPSSTAP